MSKKPPTPERIDELKSLVSTLLDAILTGEMPISEFMSLLGITAGRTAVEVARIAYAPDEGALSVEEILTDAAIRSQLLRKEATKEEMILVLQDHYRREAEKNKGAKRMEVSAPSKLSALNQLRDTLGMKWYRNNATSWDQSKRNVINPTSSDNRTVPWSTATSTENKAASA